MAVDRLTASICHLLGKSEFEFMDSIMVNGAVEFSCSSISRFRPDQWLDMDIIAVGMELVERPTFVRYCMSVPLDENKNGKSTPITNPFGYCKRKIAEWQQKAPNDPLVVFCPVNTGTNHFTLLEFNYALRKIYHYDSLSKSPSGRGPKNSRVQQAVQVNVLFVSLATQLTRDREVSGT